MYAVDALDKNCMTQFAMINGVSASAKIFKASSFY
jgi:hypothetical protein